MDLNIEKFQKWLEQGGCDILPPTNEYEALKFKGRIIGIVYKSGKTSNKYTARAIKFFKENKKWDGYPPNVGRKSNYKKEKIQVLERDGDQCFFCNKKLGDDITLEHLLPLSRGGRNDLANMVLMHEKCNNELSNLPLIDKKNKRTIKIIEVWKIFKKSSRKYLIEQRRRKLAKVNIKELIKLKIFKNS